ncbi:MAG: XRE family transcriptional regulator [Bacteroidota bacterium]
MPKDIISEIGKRMKNIRISNKQTQQEVVENAGVTKGLLSRIENGRTIPSLPVFISLVKALRMKPEDILGSIDAEKEEKYIHIRVGEMQKFEKEGATGYNYYFIYNKNFLDTLSEMVILEIEPQSERECVSTDAYEFKYMIEGEVEYEIDDTLLILQKGDALFFDGRLLHVPRNKTYKKATMLVIYFYRNAAVNSGI